MPGATIRVAKKILERIQAEVDNINENGENSFKISFSKGFSEYSYDNQLSLERLIQLAYLDMYNEKDRIKELNKEN